MSSVNHLDPEPGPSIPFRQIGETWFDGNRPARAAAEIVEDGDRVVIFELGPHGEVVDVAYMFTKPEPVNMTE